MSSLMILTPKELDDVLVYVDYAPLPILKSNATNEQKIIYANYIIERLNENKIDIPFFSKNISNNEIFKLSKLLSYHFLYAR